MSPGGAQGNGEHLIFCVVRFVDEAGARLAVRAKDVTCEGVFLGFERLRGEAEATLGRRASTE